MPAQPANSQGGRLVDELSTASVAQGLLDDRHDAGLTFSDLATEHPDRFQVLEAIGTVDDAWMVFGREPVAAGTLVADARSPASQVFQRLLMERRR